MQNQALNDLLRRWLRGETPRREERQLERATQDDEFLADAWEGYHQAPSADHLRQIDRLNQRIAQRSSSASSKLSPLRIWLPRLSAAAAVLLLITLSWTWWTNQPHATQEDLAITVPKTSDPTKPVADTPQLVQPADVAVVKEGVSERSSSRARKGSSATAGLEAEALVADEPLGPSKLDAVAEADLEEKPAPVENAKRNITERNNAAGETALGPPAAPSVKDQLQTEASTQLNARNLQVTPLIGGIVLDDAGQLASGVPVQHKPNTFAITNREGAFELPSNQPTVVNIVAEDFESRSLRLEDANEKVVLQRKTQAQKKSFNARDRQEGVGYPSPEGGFEAFERYIKNNLDIPYEAKRQQVSGTVTLEFTFEKDGTPTRFNVLRPLGFGCDQAAQHLIENGPKWKNVKPGTWVTYKVVIK